MARSSTGRERHRSLKEARAAGSDARPRGPPGGALAGADPGAAAVAPAHRGLPPEGHDRLDGPLDCRLAGRRGGRRRTARLLFLLLRLTGRPRLLICRLRLRLPRRPPAPAADEGEDEGGQPEDDDAPTPWLGQEDDGPVGEPDEEADRAAPAGGIDGRQEEPGRKNRVTAREAATGTQKTSAS